MPVTKAVFDHLQGASAEAASFLAYFLFDTLPVANTLYILHGGIVDRTYANQGGGISTVSQGLAYWNGELYEIPSGGFIDAGASNHDVLVYLDNALAYGANTVKFSDNVDRPVLQRMVMKFRAAIPGSISSGDYICEYDNVVRMHSPRPVVENSANWTNTYYVKFDRNYNTFFSTVGGSLKMAFDLDPTKLSIGATTRLHLTFPASVTSVSYITSGNTHVQEENGTLASVTPGVATTIYVTYHGFGNGWHRISVNVVH